MTTLSENAFDTFLFEDLIYGVLPLSMAPLSHYLCLFSTVQQDDAERRGKARARVPRVSDDAGNSVKHVLRDSSETRQEI